MLEFSGPINFLGPSPKAVEAVKENAKLIRYYPDPNPVEFKEQIAKYVGNDVEAENLLLGNGSIELIYMITEILPKGFKALIPVPSFSEYEKAALESWRRTRVSAVAPRLCLGNRKNQESNYRRHENSCVSVTHIVHQARSIAKKRF